MNPAILRAPRGSSRSAAVPQTSSATPRADALKQLRLHGDVDDLPRRWERIVEQGERA